MARPLKECKTHHRSPSYRERPTSFGKKRPASSFVRSVWRARRRPTLCAPGARRTRLAGVALHLVGHGARLPRTDLYRLAFFGTLEGPATWRGYATGTTKAAPKRAASSSRMKAAPVQRTIECLPAKNGPAPGPEGALEKKHFPPPTGAPAPPPEGELAPHPEGALAGPNRPPPEGAHTSIFRSPRDHSVEAAPSRRASHHVGLPAKAPGSSTAVLNSGAMAYGRRNRSRNAPGRNRRSHPIARR